MAVSSFESSSTPISMQTPQSDAALTFADADQQYADSLFSWAQQVWTQISTLSDNVVQQFLSNAATAMDFANNSIARYEQIFQPMENQLVQDANEYASTGKIAQQMGMAESDVEQAGQAGTQQSEMALNEYGIDPSAGRYADLDRTSRIQTAAAAAGAGEQAELATEATGRQLRSDAIQVGLQYPAAAVNEMNMASNNLSGAINSALGTVQAGAAAYNPAAQFAGTAMQLKYPPVGTQSQSSGGSSSPQQQKQPSSGNQGNQGNGGTTRIPLGNPATPGGGGGGSGGGGGVNPGILQRGVPGIQQVGNNGATTPPIQTGTDQNWTGNPNGQGLPDMNAFGDGTIGTQNAIDPVTGIPYSTEQALPQQSAFNPNSQQDIGGYNPNNPDYSTVVPGSTDLSQWGNYSTPDTSAFPNDPNQYQQYGGLGLAQNTAQQTATAEQTGQNTSDTPTNFYSDTQNLGLNLGNNYNPNNWNDYGPQGNTNTNDANGNPYSFYNPPTDPAYNAGTVQGGPGQGSYTAQGYGAGNNINTGQYNPETDYSTPYTESVTQGGDPNAYNPGQFSEDLNNLGGDWTGNAADTSYSGDVTSQGGDPNAYNPADFQDQLNTLDQQSASDQTQMTDLSNPSTPVNTDYSSSDTSTPTDYSSSDTSSTDYSSGDTSSTDYSSGDTSSYDTSSYDTSGGDYSGDYSDSSDVSSAGGGAIPAVPMRGRGRVGIPQRPMQQAGRPAFSRAVPRGQPFRAPTGQPMARPPMGRPMAQGGRPGMARPSTGGHVPYNASPSQGRQTDDIPARLNAGEFVVPRDVAAWKGQEFFQKLIKQSRQNLMGAQAKPKMKPAMHQAPRFVSRGQ